MPFTEVLNSHYYYRRACHPLPDINLCSLAVRLPFTLKRFSIV